MILFFIDVKKILWDYSLMRLNKFTYSLNIWFYCWAFIFLFQIVVDNKQMLLFRCCIFSKVMYIFNLSLILIVSLLSDFVNFFISLLVALLLFVIFIKFVLIIRLFFKHWWLHFILIFYFILLFEWSTFLVG